MLDLKALLTKIVEGIDKPQTTIYELGAKLYLDTFFNTSYSSALANSYQFKSFMAAQYNHQYRSMPVNVFSSRVVGNMINPRLGLYAYNLLMFEYNHTYSGTSHPWGIIYMTGVLNHIHEDVTDTTIGYQPSGSAYCDRENIKIQLNDPMDLVNPHYVASRLYNAKVVAPFVANNMRAPWITPYVTKTSERDVTLDMTTILRKKATDTTQNAFSAIIVYWS